MSTIAHRPAELVVSDAEEFLSRDGITSKAGCTFYQLPTLAIKEIVDNAFDFDGAAYEYDEETGEHIISDEGPGLSKEDILRLFNIRRDMNTTKRWRRAGRGALGNGLRVACAAVRLLEGIMIVRSRDGAFRVNFDEIGETQLVEIDDEPRTVGTEIKVRIGGAVDVDIIEDCTLVPGAIHTGPANAWAFGMMQFRQHSRLCSHMTEREFAAQFGCDLGRDMPLAELDDDAIEALRGKLKRGGEGKNTTLPGMGEGAMPHLYYAEAAGMVAVGGGSIVPATVEAWAIATRGTAADAVVIGLWMNRTRSITKPAGAYYDGNISLRECGLKGVPCKAGKAQYEIALAITTSYYPMISTGKAPDLAPFTDLIKKAVRKAAKDAFDFADAPEKKQKADIPEKPKWMNPVAASYAVIEDAVRHATSNFKYPAKPHQIWYPAVAMIKDRFAHERKVMEWIDKPDNVARNRFVSTHLKDYQELFDTTHWPVIDIDSRGSASEPHDGLKNIQLSTSDVSKYTDPKRTWKKNFGALLFIEKEQFRLILAPVLNEFDIEIVESKGQGTIAEKNLLLWAEEQGLPIFVFSDCDVAGYMIYNTIRKGSKYAKPVPSAKRIGLTLEQARGLDLLPEPKIPGVAHLSWLRKSDLDGDLKEFLHRSRFELNHLNTEQMRDLLRKEFTRAGLKKVMPSDEDISEHVRNEAKEAMREMIMDHAEKRIKEFADKATEDLECFELIDKIREHLDEHRQQSWKQALDHIIEELEIISEPLSKENP